MKVAQYSSGSPVVWLWNYNIQIEAGTLRNIYLSVQYEWVIAANRKLSNDKGAPNGKAKGVQIDKGKG